MGDDHIYPLFPLSWNFITDFAKLDQDNPHPFFMSEGGIGSLYNAFEEKRQMEKAHAPAWSPSWEWINATVDGAPKTWATYGLNETYPNPEDAFIDSQLETARQRELIFTLVRSNPKVIAYSLTSNQDYWGASEGVMNNFFDFKPGHLEVLQAGWASLRWCLLVHPTNVYADAPIRIKATLANEDALPGGDYPATLDITGAYGVVWKQAVTAHVQTNGPLAYILFDDDIHIADLKAGSYTLEAAIDGRPNAASNKIAFTVTDRASLPTISGAVTVAGVRQDIRDLLTKQGAQVHDYAIGNASDRETILVGPDFKGKASDWRALYARAARGAHVVFLSNPIFHGDKVRNKWLALPTKGDQSNDPDWLYHKEVIAKVNHPLFAGLQTKLMTPEYYDGLLARSFYFKGITNPAPSDTAAQGIAVLLGGVFPVGLHRGPARAEALDISIAVLGDERSDAVRKAQGDAQPGGRPVIKNIDRKFLQADLLHEIPHDLRDVLEGVMKGVVSRCIGKSKAWQVRGYDMEVARQLRNQIAKHVARGGKAMEQKHGWLLRITRFAIENLKAVHEVRLIGYRGRIHGGCGGRVLMGHSSRLSQGGWR
jgi:hypothetical protein